VVHPGRANVPKAELQEKLAEVSLLLNIRYYTQRIITMLFDDMLLSMICF